MRQVCNEKFFLLLFLSLLANITSIRGAERLGCQDRDIDLRCPSNQVLQIVSSFYGRSESIPCHTDDKERMMNTKCSLSTALEVTSNKCNNQTTCNIDFKSFPDPCPDTYKYLKISFKCVVYVFTCPGSLVGVRSRHPLETVFRYNREASWSKDPLFKPKRIYYHVNGDPTIKEYEDESIFRQGGAFITHDLKSMLKSSHFAVFDGYIYYYKELSGTIARYSTKIKSRRTEANLPQSADMSPVEDVRLAVDEQGIWMSYYRGESGLTILKLDPSLEIKKQWQTDITRRHKHIIFVCGVMYAFDDGSTASTFNTNNGVTSRNSMFNDRDHLQDPTISSLHYNPRDRILMAWQDASAVYYRLDFSPVDPTRKEDLSTKNGRTVSSTLTTTTVDPGQVRPVHGKCPAEKVHDLQWPQTVGGKTSKIECFDKVGEFASWRCVLDAASGEASWDPNGPDRADCLTSFNYIRHRIARGDKDVAEKLPALLEEKAHIISGIDITALATATKLFVNERMMYSEEDGTELAKVVISAVNALTSPSCVRKVRQMVKTKRYLFISDIISAVESALLNISKKSLGKGGFVMRMSNLATLGYSYDRLQTYDAVFKETSNETMTGNFNEQKDNWAHLPFQQGDSFEDVAVVGFALFRRLDQCLSVADVANWRLDSDMVSISIDGGGGEEDEIDLDNEARVTLRHQSVDKPRKHKCVYWSPSNSNPLSPWSDAGCREISSNSTHTTCGLRHLTTFALLAQVDTDRGADGHGEFGADSRDSWFDNPTLSISMSVGISVSALCLFFCFTTFIVFKKLQNDLNCIVKHFSMTLFVAEVSYMVAMHRPSNEIACYVVAFLLHLSLLATFVWLALETFQIYVLLGDYVEPSSYRWKWYYLIGYGGPTVIVMVSAFVNIRGYQGDTWCWLDVRSSSMLAFILPLIVAVVTSITFLMITMVKLHRQSTVLTDSSRLRMVKNGVRSAGSLLFLLGLTWMFGLVWMWERSLIIAYLFLFFNVFQGFFVFFVHCVLQRKVRREYSDRLNGWRCCLGKSRMGDMTYVSSSMSFSKHYTSPGSARYNTTVPCASNLANPNNQSQLRRLWSETIVNGGSGGNQHPSESAAILYNSESVPTRDHSVSNYGQGCPGSNGGNGGYLEPQMLANQQQQQQQEQHERRHNNMAEMNYCHNNSCRADEQHLARESTYKYDRLDRHGLPSNTPDDMTSRNDDAHPNNRVYTDITVDQDQECSCARRHHQSRPQQRSYTMNPHSTTVASTQSNSMPDTAVHCHHGVARASTISKAVQQQHHHWPEEYATPVNQEDASSMCIRPYQITPLAPISANRRRTSMNSTEESDITNDMSTSSFENRTSIGRATNVVPQHQIPQHPKEHMRHSRPERWTPVTTSRPGYDENDLEVERCLFSRDNNSNNAYPATERDSAFYQSMPDLNHQATPSSNLCYGSSPSSGCSPEMASADDDLHHHHHHASSFQTRRTSEQSSLISAPQNNASNAKSFASTGATTNSGGGGSGSDTRQPSSRSKRVYEDVSLLSDAADHLDSGNGPRPTYVLTASRLNRDDDFARGESPVRLSGSHLQTCL